MPFLLWNQDMRSRPSRSISFHCSLQIKTLNNRQSNATTNINKNHAALVMTLLRVLKLKANNVGWLNVQVHIPAVAHSASTPTIKWCQHCQYFAEATPLYVAQRPRHKESERSHCHEKNQKGYNWIKNQPSFNGNQGPPAETSWLWFYDYDDLRSETVCCVLWSSAHL